MSGEERDKGPVATTATNPGADAKGGGRRAGRSVEAKAQSAASRQSFRHRLGPMVLRALHEKLLRMPVLTTELMEELDREFGLREKYFVRQRLWQFLMRE